MGSTFMDIWITRESNAAMAMKFFDRMWVHFSRPRKYLVKELYLGEPNEYIQWISDGGSVRLDVLAKNINMIEFYDAITLKMFQYFGTDDLNEWFNSPRTHENFLMTVHFDLIDGLLVKQFTTHIVEANEDPIINDLTKQPF